MISDGRIVLFRRSQDYLQTFLKHRTILKLIYSGGLRISEVVHLKIKDIEKDRKVIRIRKAKGNKDRIVCLSDKLLIELREYYKIYKPKVYLFEGTEEGKPYSTRSIQNIFNKAKYKSRINKKRLCIHCDIALLHIYLNLELI